MVRPPPGKDLWGTCSNKREREKRFWINKAERIHTGVCRGGNEVRPHEWNPQQVKTTPKHLGLAQEGFQGQKKTLSAQLPPSMPALWLSHCQDRQCSFLLHLPAAPGPQQSQVCWAAQRDHTASPPAAPALLLLPSLTHSRKYQFPSSNPNICSVWTASQHYPHLRSAPAPLSPALGHPSCLSPECHPAVPTAGTEHLHIPTIPNAGAEECEHCQCQQCQEDFAERNEFPPRNSYGGRRTVWPFQGLKKKIWGFLFVLLFLFVFLFSEKLSIAQVGRAQRGAKLSQHHPSSKLNYHV